MTDHCPLNAFFAGRCGQRALIAPVLTEVDALQELLYVYHSCWIVTFHVYDFEDGIKEGRIVVRP